MAYQGPPLHEGDRSMEKQARPFFAKMTSLCLGLSGNFAYGRLSRPSLRGYLHRRRSRNSHLLPAVDVAVRTVSKAWKDVDSFQGGTGDCQTCKFLLLPIT